MLHSIVGKFLKIVIFGKKIEKKISAQIALHSFILQLNAENRIYISAVYNEIHVLKLFLYGIYMLAILSKFWVVYKSDISAPNSTPNISTIV